MNDLDPAVRIRSLGKSFHGSPALVDIDLTVPASTFFGLAGPNGAGKSTLINILTGLLGADAGDLAIFGHDILQEPLAAKATTGVLMDSSALFHRLTGMQLVVHAGMLRGLGRADAKERARDLISLFGLDEAAQQLVVDYSTGMQKKVALAAAIVHAPRLLVLDEPFESIDPVSTITMRRVLEYFVAGGGTVLMSSHSMDLVERTCDQMAIIAEGRVLATGSVDEVRAGGRLEDRFVELVGGQVPTEGPAWLQPS